MYTFSDDSAAVVCQVSGALPSSEAADITMQICDALMDLHKWSIIVRDLKPNNILYDERGRHFVGDFGMAVKMQVASDAVAHGSAD